MQKLNFNYRVKRGVNCWVFLLEGTPKYRLIRGQLSGTWYIYHTRGTSELYCAGTLRDCVIQCLRIEGII